MKWTDVIYVKWFCFEVKWSEVSYAEVLGDKSTMHIRVTLYLRVLDCIVTISFSVFLVLFGNMCTCIYCVFVMFCLCISIPFTLLFNFVCYVLLLCLCILIVMYVLFCILCFHRFNWHSSATLIEVFPCFFLSCKANARVILANTGHAPHSSQINLYPANVENRVSS